MGRTPGETPVDPEPPVRFRRDEPLAGRTWFGLGGAAALFATPADENELASLVRWCARAGRPWYLLGRGANLLVADAGVDGVVVRLEAPAFRGLSLRGERIRVGGGHDLARLLIETARAGVSGLEGLAGIPATVGGAVRMNAGGAFGEIGAGVQGVRVLEADGTARWIAGSALPWGYRDSGLAGRAVLEVELAGAASRPERVRAAMKRVFAHKKATQPLSDASAGCAFKNPAGGAPPAAALIDRAGLKGAAVGAARVSQRHANFVVAEPGCTARDVAGLIDHVRGAVAARFGVELEPELVRWP